MTWRRFVIAASFLFLFAALVLMVTDPLANGIADRGQKLGPFPTGDGDAVEVTP